MINVYTDGACSSNGSVCAKSGIGIFFGINDKRNISKNIDTSFLSQYTKLLGKYGQGMAPISRNSCNNCYTSLPPQLIVEIKYDKKIITCPSCSVFLYHKNEDN